VSTLLSEILIVIFAVAVVSGLEIIFEKLHRRITGRRFKEYHAPLGRFIFLFSFVIAALILTAAILGGYPFAVVFAIFAFAGPFLEWTVGTVYLKLSGRRLWTYHAFSISSHTSWVAALVWGIAGVIFLLLENPVYSTLF
jgi:hypothetical protein